MENREIAKIIRLAFKKLLDTETAKATRGNTDAAINVMKYLTAQNLSLRSIGYELNDHGRLVKYSKKPQSEMVRLSLLAKEGNLNAAEELLKLINK
jgi:hypothetical protein